MRIARQGQGSGNQFSRQGKEEEANGAGSRALHWQLSLQSNLQSNLHAAQHARRRPLGTSSHHRSDGALPQGPHPASKRTAFAGETFKTYTLNTCYKDRNKNCTEWAVWRAHAL